MHEESIVDHNCAAKVGLLTTILWEEAMHRVGGGQSQLDVATDRPARIYNRKVYDAAA